MSSAASIPATPSTNSQNKTAGWQPYECDPELYGFHIAESMMEKMGAPGIVSKEFVIWYGMLKGINHRAPGTLGTTDPGNETYFDCTLLLSVFDGVFHHTVNINGALFEKFWQFLMKPKMIVQGIMGQTTFDEQAGKQSLWEKYAPQWLGGKGGEKTNANKPE
jgi:hypothetical protein